MDVFRGSLPIGTIVKYFPRANSKAPEESTSGPLIGIVHRSSDGLLDLVVVDYRGNPSLEKAVYQISHPDLRDAFGQISGAGIMAGSWDYAEVHRVESEKQESRKKVTA